MLRLVVVLAVGLTFSAACRSPDLHVLFAKANADRRAGRLTVAAETVRTGLEQASRAGQTEWAWRFLILSAEVSVDRGDPKAGEKVLAGLPATLVAGEIAAAREKTLALIALRTGRPGEAETHLQRASALAAVAPSALTIELSFLKARLFAATRRPDLAERANGEAFDLATRAHEPFWRAKVMNSRGYDRIQQERYDQAVPFLEAALVDARVAGAEGFAASVSRNLGICQYRLGEFEGARRNLEDAATTHERLAAMAELEASLGEMGNYLVFMREPQKAVPFYTRALTLAKEHAPTHAPLWASNLAQAYLLVKDWTNAERLNEDVLRLTGSASRPSPFFALNAAGIAMGRDDLSRAETLCLDVLAQSGDETRVRWAAESMLASLYARRGDRVRADRFFAQALGHVEAARAGLKRLEHRLSFLTDLIHFHRDYVAWLVKDGRPEEALAIVEGSRARVLSERLARDRPPSSSKRDLRKVARQRGEVFLSYWVTPERSYVWVITPARIEVAVLPDEAKLRRLVEAYRTAIETSLKDPLTVERSPGRDLYDALVGPISKHLPPGSRVVIAPDGPLHALPFAALIAPGPHYWVEDVTIATAPALTTVPLREPGRGFRGMLAIGDPEAGGETFPRLAGASSELDDVARSFEGTVEVRGPAARPEAYSERNPAKFSIIHFAAHAIANAASPLDSSIVLSPGATGNRLSVRDVIDIPLAADVVTISGCRAAGARTYSGEGLVGVAWAFLTAGARHVVAGHWDVADRSTAELMKRMYQALAAGQDPATALRTAQLAMLESSGIFRRPFHWAPFQVFLGSAPTDD